MTINKLKKDCCQNIVMIITFTILKDISQANHLQGNQDSDERIGGSGESGYKDPRIGGSGESELEDPRIGGSEESGYEDSIGQ